MTNDQLKKQWENEVSAKLVGRRIVGIRYMTKKEVGECAWGKSAVILRLDDDTLLYPMADDEGNDAGALATTDENLLVIPAI